MLDDERFISRTESENKKMFGLVIPHRRNGSRVIDALKKMLMEKGVVVISELELPADKIDPFRVYQKENGAGIILKMNRTLNELEDILGIVKPAARFIPENCIL